MRRLWPVLVCVLSLAACSVSTPRHGATLGAGRASSTGGAGADETAAAADATGGGAVDGASGGGGSAASGGAVGTQSGPASGRQSASGQAAGAQSVSRSAAVGVTKDTIVVSVSMPFGGPIGAYYESLYTNGVVAWAKEVNEKGGIHGRKIELKRVDNKGTSDGGIAACKEERSNGSFVTLGVTSIDSEANCMDGAGRVMLHGLTSLESPKWKHVRSVTSYPEIAHRIVEFMRGSFGKIPDKPTGVIYNRNDPNFGPMGPIFVNAAKAAGQNIVAVKTVNGNEGSYVSELQSLRSAGATAVVLLNNLEVVAILRDAKAIGYQPIFTGGQWMADEFSQAGYEFMVGIKGVRSAPAVDSAAYKAYAAKMQKYGSSSSVVSGYTAYTWGLADILGQAMRAAGPNLDQASFLAGFETMKNYDNGLVPPATWGPGILNGSPGAFPVECCHPDRTWKGLGPAQNRF